VDVGEDPDVEVIGDRGLPALVHRGRQPLPQAVGHLRGRVQAGQWAAAAPALDPSPEADRLEPVGMVPVQVREQDVVDGAGADRDARARRCLREEPASS
jgi:hypothetical protein